MSAANLNSVPNSIVAPENNIPAPAVLESAPAQTERPESAPKVDPNMGDKLTSSRFAHLSKKEAALVKEREAFKKEMEAFKAEQSEASKYRKAWEMVNEIAELQKTDAVAAMRKAGFSDQDLMNFLSQAQDNSSPEEKATKMAKAEIEKFRAEQNKLMEDNNKKAEELKKVGEDRTIAKFKNDIGSHIKSDVDKYEYLNFYGEAAQELVYETISAIMNDSGEMVSVDEASQMVEDWYEENDKAMNSLKKRGVHRVVKPAESAAVKSEPARAPSAQMPKTTSRVESKQFVDNRIPTKTLSNRAAATTASLVQSELSHEQNKQAIIEKYKSFIRR